VAGVTSSLKGVRQKEQRAGLLGKRGGGGGAKS